MMTCSQCRQLASIAKAPGGTAGLGSGQSSGPLKRSLCWCVGGVPHRADSSEHSPPVTENCRAVQATDWRLHPRLPPPKPPVSRHKREVARMASLAGPTGMPL